MNHPISTSLATEEGKLCIHLSASVEIPNARHRVKAPAVFAYVKINTICPYCVLKLRI